ncbi:hypothetical protein [Mesorhizobium sp.]|uniref:hypothetical protein n=1 Tax=Mesorhizobium sp. TaxID=1871066 RepID=UPI00258009C1|nr:hypothetical protein [Mesorhizobium sp.]
MLRAELPNDSRAVSKKLKAPAPHLPGGEAGIKNIEIWMDERVRSNDAIALT